MRHNKKSILLIFLLAGFVLFLSRCINSEAETKDPRGMMYAGAAACRQCHQAIYDSFATVAHAKASSRALAENIRGNFNNDHDAYVYNKNTKMVMEKRADSFYQVLYQNGKENGAYKFDLLFGFRNAQTSAYWSNDKFYELPLSHYAAVNAWVSSPGFPADFVKLGRLVNTDCLDCHSSGINTKNTGNINADQTFDKASLIYGIDCERCHGPGMNHVNYHEANPGLKTAAYMVRNNMLSRQQKLDACAVCHSGNDKPKIQSRFLFKMGDSLSQFFLPKFGHDKGTIDVHGNQFSLLQQSQCFRNSNNMTCGTCHNPHEDATKKSLAVYSQQCMSCHKPESSHFCPEFASLGESIKTNCIDCHMPKQESLAITFQLQGSDTKSAYILRTHKIAVYKDSLLHVKK